MDNSPHEGTMIDSVLDVVRKEAEGGSHKPNLNLQPPGKRKLWKWTQKGDSAAAEERRFGYHVWEVPNRYARHLLVPGLVGPVFDTKKRGCAGAACSQKTLQSKRRL